MATAKLISERNTINITATQPQVLSWWRKVCLDGLTTSAAKYVNVPRRAFGVWIIDANADLGDALLVIWQAVPAQWKRH